MNDRTIHAELKDDSCGIGRSFMRNFQLLDNQMVARMRRIGLFFLKNQGKN